MKEDRKEKEGKYDERRTAMLLFGVEMRPGGSNIAIGAAYNGIWEIR